MELSRNSLFAALIATVALCWVNTARADHYSGGNITYRCLGGNFFEVTLDVYLDCSGAPLTSQNLQLSNDCGVAFTVNGLPLTLTEEVSQLCGASVPNSTCNGGTLPGIMHYQFVTTLFLSPCNDWTIAWDICCRTGLQNTSGTPGMYLEATVNNAGGLCDSSPVLADNSIPFVCVNQPVSYNTGFSDPDGNSMSFELIAARFASPAPTNINYSGGFTGIAPIPGITIDPNTGQLAFTPTATGSYVVVVEVTTYDTNGVPIGTVMRDFLFVVSNCAGTPPTTTGLTNGTAGFITGTGSVEVCDGVPFCVDIPFSDADPGAITLTSNAAALLPGATFVVTGGNPAVGRLCWTPDPAFSPANILISARDNACPIPNEASTSVLITVVDPPAVPPDAGSNGSVNSCTAGPSISLFPLLGGTPDAGGVWTDPNGVVNNGIFVPSSDPFGSYTYTVGNGCQTDVAIVAVNANGGADPGTNGTLNICGNAASVPLINSLGGSPQAGGAWTGPSVVTGGNYTPATMAPGVYTYTVPGVAPCPSASATVTVSESSPPNAGTNGTLAICSNGAGVALVSRLGGTPAAGGTWSGPSVTTGNYDPATMAPGVYTYTVAGSGSCADATATVTVTENALPSAGSNGTLALCSSGASVALNASLGGSPQAGGTWSGPSAVVGGNYDPATMVAGVYTYTVNGTAPCTNATATVTVTENAAPNAGSNGTLAVCSNGASVALNASLGGSPQAGGTWSGPSPVVGGNYDPATMVAGIYTYTVTGTAPCANSTATVTVTENTAPNAGSNGTFDVCSNGASMALNASLGGSPQAGGTWSGPSAVVGGNYDPATMAAGVYTYTVNGTAPCANSTATVTVTENAAPNAGSNGTLDVCSNGASIALNASLGGSPQVGGTWSGPSTVVGGNYDPATMVAGVYTYTVNGTAPCTNATATVTVTENAAPNAGSNGTLDVCSNGASMALNASLGGSPQGGGTWSGPSAVVGGNYDPATMVAGVYTYTVSGTAPCANATATVSVIENVAPNAGSNGTLAVCSTGASVALNASLGGSPQAGGTWSGPSPVVGGNYDPATMVAGIYTYTVTGTAPCANSTATVTVTENTAPNAGTNGGLSICSDGAPVQLSGALGGSPQVGGTWSGPSGVVGGNYDPATMDDGVYTYTILGVAPCANSTASVTVTESTVPNAGTNGILSVCSDGVSVALAASLGGSPQPGGTWSGPSAVVGGIYDPGSMAPGIYTYLILGAVPCVDASASVMVVESMAPEAGSDGSLTSCSDGVPQVLFTSLGGTPQMGGTWAGPSVVVGGNYDPLSMDPGIYTYTVAGSAPCSNSSAAVTVVENVAPNAGSNGSLTVCDAGGPVALLNSLGGTPQPGGTWSGPSAVVGGNYDPATMVAGVYTYTVVGTAPCANATATVAVNETGSPDAGTDGTINLCSNGASTDIFAQLGGSPDAGGTWSGPSALNGSNYDPATMAPGVYTYTLTATAPCVGDASTVTVTENVAPNAGSSGSLTVCDAGGPVALLNSLGGTPQAGGTWSGPSAVIGGNYDPATMVAGVYTYTVNGTAPCAIAIATVAVNETGSPDAGTDGTINLCSNGASTDLFAQLGGSPDAGGTWSGPSALNGSNYDPATMVPGVYTYTLTATAPCVGDASTVTVTENVAPNAGSSGSLTVCDAGGPVALLNSLGGTPQAGGTWSGPSAVIGGNYDPATMVAGVYTYTVNGTAPCANATATVAVNETGSPDAGTDGTINLCSNGAPTDLFAQLGGSPDAGGTWSGPSALNGSNYDPATMTPGTYTYALLASAPCASASATVEVQEELALDAGTSSDISLCAGAPAQSLFSILQGTPDAGGTWTGPGGASNGQFDPGSDPPGTYTYTHTGSTCPGSSASVTIAIQTGPDAGGDAMVSLCSNSGVVQLFDQLTGSPDAGGAWTLPNGTPTTPSFDPLQSDGGTFIYTVPGGADCPADQATVSIVVNISPQAGTSGSLALCASSVAVSLFEGLTGTLDAGGTWAAPDGTTHASIIDPASDVPGQYTYTVSGVAPCITASSTVNVLIAAVPDAGDDAVALQCSSNAPFNLTTALAGTPQTNGTWYGPEGDVVPALFAPASNDPGTYTYIVPGVAPCGNDQSTLVVTVNQAADAGADATVQLCENVGSQVDLLDQLNGSPNGAGSWTAPDGTAFDGTFAPGNDQPGTYRYEVTAPAPCPTASALVVVDVIPTPEASIVVSGADGCVPAEVVLSSTYAGSGSCQWTLWNGEVIDDCAPITRTLTEAGIYGATLQIEAGNGCGQVVIDSPDLFSMFATPVAAFYHLPEAINTLDPNVAFNNASTDAVRFEWDIAGLATSSAFHTSYSFPPGLAAEYTVCLAAIASPTCADTVCRTITIEDGLNVFVPNTFTPDGDGTNDDFKPVMIGADPDTYRFFIFDRWGQPLFETDDPSGAWNGNFSDGSEVPIGVYVWKVTVKDRVTTSRMERVGHVTLLR